MKTIHASAIVSSEARLGRNVVVGPLCVIEAGTVIGDRCRLGSHVVVKRGTTLGTDNEISDGAILGGRPQHRSAPPTTGRLEIGNGNTIREYATLHVALDPARATVVGDENFVMVCAHVAHDCVVQNHTILANNVMLAGHVTVGDYAYLSGAAGVHQFCRIGAHAIVGGQAHITQDVPPFVTVDGRTSQVAGLNLIGLRRSGFTTEEIGALKAAYRLIYRQGLTMNEILARLPVEFPAGPAAAFYQFFGSGRRGFVSARKAPRPAAGAAELPAIRRAA